MLFHARNVIERGLSKKQYSDMQLDPRNMTGAETAIIRHFATSRKMKYMEILDLDSTYNQVTRENLMNRLTEKLNERRGNDSYAPLAYATNHKERFNKHRCHLWKKDEPERSSQTPLRLLGRVTHTTEFHKTRIKWMKTSPTIWIGTRYYLLML